MDFTNFSFDVDADGIALATLNSPGKSMNTLGRVALDEIATIVRELASNDAIKGLVFASGKEGSFCAGADLFELAQEEGGFVSGDTPEQQFEAAFRINRLFREMETIGKPVAVAINGLALGGGLELSMSCHYRVASNDNPKLKVGLPESRIGLIPGFGGTQRLPRLIGAQAAAPYLLEGKSMSAQEALGLGVVHALASTDDLVTNAKAWVKSNPKVKQPWDQDKFKLPGGVPNQHPGATQMFMVGTAMMMKETSGNYPAQKAIMSAVYEGLMLDMDTALKVESRYFFNTINTPEAHGMIRTLFQSTQAVSKGASRPTGVPRYNIQKVAVIGAGLMGAGIAYAQAKVGISTVLIDKDEASAEKGKAYSARLVDKAVSRAKMSRDEADALLANITPTTDYGLIEGSDLVVEAIYENPALKAEILSAAESGLTDTAVLGSNTSSLPISRLADSTKRPENFIGIHFFSPVEKMQLVELIRGEKTTDETLAKAIDYVLKIHKTPIAVSDSRGFYTSRCFMTYTQEGLDMVTEGVSPVIVENVGRMAGMPMGPLEVMDSVGLDTGLKISRETARAINLDLDGTPAGQLMSWMVEDKGRLGRKDGKGFYDYNEKGRAVQLWPGLSDKVPVTTNECPPEHKEELTKRLLFRQCIEVARCFEEGVITDARDADVGSIFAWGFAPYSGGAVSYMDLNWGLTAFVNEADRLTSKYGSRFEPPMMMREMAINGETFYSRFPPAEVNAET